MILSGKVWKLGDNVGATDLLPGRYDKAGMSQKWDECAKHLLEDMLPEFATKVQKGDIIIAGENLGVGHAHYYMGAVKGCWAAGIGALLAKNVSGLFFRCAIDAGMPAWSFDSLPDFVDNGDHLELNLESGETKNITRGTSILLAPVPLIILDILRAGGSENWGLRRVGAEHAIE